MLQCLERERDSLPESDALIVCIMSHGEEKAVFGTDENKVEINEIVEIFNANHCEKLKGKLKIYFIQACRIDGELSSKLLIKWTCTRVS